MEKKRNESYQALDLLARTAPRTVFKMEIPKRLLEEGRVSIKGLIRDLEGKFDFKFDSFYMEAFYRTFVVIEDYIKTGGKNIIGGTGLPRI
ncbi:MAG: hypothetical protein GTN40_05030 [Candidatus Aenigmarchaeota archaeon]|nr:hypothetical protein [Candidatus Aenigmarchaeota archaeon]